MENMKSDLFKTLEAISDSKNYNTWIYSKVNPYLKGTVLDVGSGLGDIVKYYKLADVQKIIATDYSSDMITAFQERFAESKHYHAMQMDILSHNFVEPLSKNSVDTITCINVLEHIDDHRKALQNMHQLLKKGGKLILIVPALPQIYGTLDKLVGHFRRYTKKTMRNVVSQTDFVIEKQSYMNFFGIMTWFLAGRIFRQKSFNHNACQRLDKVVPVLRTLESFMTPPIGQSLVTVCRAE